MWLAMAGLEASRTSGCARPLGARGFAGGVAVMLSRYSTLPYSLYSAPRCSVMVLVMIWFVWHALCVMLSFYGVIWFVQK